MAVPASVTSSPGQAHEMEPSSVDDPLGPSGHSSAPDGDRYPTERETLAPEVRVDRGRGRSAGAGYESEDPIQERR